MAVTPTRLIASLLFSAACTAAAVTPQRLIPRFGKFGGLFIVMLLGAILGVILAVVSTECSIWSAPCRATLGSWILVGLLLPVCFAVFRHALGISATFSHAVSRLFRRLLSHSTPVPTKRVSSPKRNTSPAKVHTKRSSPR